MPTQQSAHAGFTLVELVVVVVILSIFAGMMSLSVGSSEARKNRAFYEHFVDSLGYLRLLAAEQMQPIGIYLQTNANGEITPVVMQLDNPYLSHRQSNQPADHGSKNSMELSAMNSQQPTQPSWVVTPATTLPSPPPNVTIHIQPLDVASAGGATFPQQLQPWFIGEQVPQILWFGTGQATPVSIEIRHQQRLVAEVIHLMPDGSIHIGTS